MAIRREDNDLLGLRVEEEYDMALILPQLTKGEDLSPIHIDRSFGVVLPGMKVLMTRDDLKPNMRLNLEDPEWIRTGEWKKV